MSGPAEYFLPFFPADAMAEYDGIFAAGAAAADAEIARLDAYWAARAAESERAYAEAEARSAEVVRRRREYESAVIFLVYPHRMVAVTPYLRDGKMAYYRHPRYVNLGPRLNSEWTDETDKYVDAAPAPAGAYYRTAEQLGFDNAVATRHYEDTKWLADYGRDSRCSNTRSATEYVRATERVWARVLAARCRRDHALAAFARHA